MENVKDTVLGLYEYLPREASGAPVVPVDLRILLDKYALKAYDVEFKDKNISGAFDRRTKKIYLDKTDPKTRKIFTLAHELGHYFLHQNVQGDIFDRDKTLRETKDPKEKEADAFAAELLMPEQSIREYWTIAESIQQLADIFAVSYLAMKTRLQHLGFI